MGFNFQNYKRDFERSNFALSTPTERTNEMSGASNAPTQFDRVPRVGVEPTRGFNLTAF